MANPIAARLLNWGWGFHRPRTNRRCPDLIRTHATTSGRFSARAPRFPRSQPRMCGTNTTSALIVAAGFGGALIAAASALVAYMEFAFSLGLRAFLDAVPMLVASACEALGIVGSTCCFVAVTFTGGAAIAAVLATCCEPAAPGDVRPYPEGNGEGGEGGDEATEDSVTTEGIDSHVGSHEQSQQPQQQQQLSHGTALIRNLAACGSSVTETVGGAIVRERSMQACGAAEEVSCTERVGTTGRSASGVVGACSPAEGAGRRDGAAEGERAIQLGMAVVTCVFCMGMVARVAVKPRSVVV